MVGIRLPNSRMNRSSDKKIIYEFIEHAIWDGLESETYAKGRNDIRPAIQVALEGNLGHSSRRVLRQK